MDRERADHIQTEAVGKGHVQRRVELPKVYVCAVGKNVP